MSLLQQLRLLLGRGESGQAMVEYAIVTALIAVVALVAVQSLGTSIVGVFRNIVSAITGI